MEDTRLLSIVSEIVVNVWARQQTEEALRQSQERFALVFQSSRDGLWDWDIAANKVFLSPDYQEQRGYTEHELDTSFASITYISSIPTTVTVSWNPCRFYLI